MRIAVIGAGVAGLGCALALARTGHDVVVLERDVTPMPADPHEAFAWDRRGAPQVRHSHAFLARLRNVLRDEYPDVLAELHAAGATDIKTLGVLPGTIDDQSRPPSDEDLVGLACRRTTFEWVLRRVVLSSRRVRLVDGAVVDGFVVDGRGASRPPVVVGVRLRSGGTVDADLVIAAAGPRAPVGRWLGDAGIEVNGTFEESGIVYLSRFYHRIRPDVDDMPRGPFVLADLGFLKCAVFPGDNATFSITLAPRADDGALRPRLLEPDGFERTCRLLAPFAPWVDTARVEPITGVHAMARLGNHRRQFLDDAGRPTVLGFHAVGDAHTCTNPLYGRGCTMAMVQAHLLAAAVADHPGDPTARAEAFEAANAREIEPWYHVAVAQDRFGRRAVDPSGAVTEDADTFIGRVVRDGLVPAARTDAVVARAFLRVLNALDTPDRLLLDPDVAGRIFRTLADPDARKALPDFGVDRDTLLAALRA